MLHGVDQPGRHASGFEAPDAREGESGTTVQLFLCRREVAGFPESMLKATSVKEALHSETARDAILVQGWVRTRRDAKGFSFIDLNDGSCLKNL